MRQSERSFFGSEIVLVYQKVFEVFQKDPIVVVLFSALAFIDLLALVLLFFFHSPPVSTILEPIIRTFTSPIYLHYPHNFVLLPKLYSAAHFCIITVFGVVVSGLVIKKIESGLIKGKIITIVKAGQGVLPRYFSIVTAWLISYGLFTLVFKFVLPLFMVNGPIFLTGTFILAVVVQSLVVYLIPALLIADNGFIKNMADGFMFGLKKMPVTMGLVALPMFFVVLMSFLRSLAPEIVKIYPELVMVVLVVGVFVMAAVDLFITSSATVLYLKARKNK